MRNSLAGSAAGDTIDGRGGDDLIGAGPGDDTVHGDDGDDRIIGYSGADTLYGDAGNDRIEGYRRRRHHPRRTRQRHPDR